jgi:hypothetical protein
MMMKKKPMGKKMMQDMDDAMLQKKPTLKKMPKKKGK